MYSRLLDEINPMKFALDTVKEAVEQHEDDTEGYEEMFNVIDNPLADIRSLDAEEQNICYYNKVQKNYCSIMS